MKKRWACVARLGAVGDNLIVSSVLPLLKRDGYLIEVITNATAGEVFENNPFIDKLTIKKDEDLPNNAADWQQWFVKRSKEYDRFHHLSNSIEGNLALNPDSTGFWWSDEVRRKKCGNSYLAETHDICGLPHEFAPGFFPTIEEDASVVTTKEKIGERMIGWVISGSRQDKIYPYSPMAVARLISETGVPVILVGARNDKDNSFAKTIMEHVERQNGSHKGLHEITGAPEGAWPLRRTLTLLQHCDLVITPDTGPAWAVAMCKMPKIMMLGHASAFNITHGWLNTVTLTADPERVPCAPCHRLHNDMTTCVPNKWNNGVACLSDISVETIVQAAKELLGEPIRAGSENLGERLRLVG
jgi:ADP-heptose:LPS heptosyltransferase